MLSCCTLGNILHQWQNKLVASRPLRTLHNELVHLKDKVDYEEVNERVHQIPCKNCDKVYVGESARNLGIRVGEHKKRSGIKRYVVIYTDK